jgi:hypothetical protein
LRAMLCEAAQHAKDQRYPLNPYFARTCARHGYSYPWACQASAGHLDAGCVAGGSTRSILTWSS